MELIYCIESRPVFITLGKVGGDTATVSVLRDAGTTTAARPSADRSGAPVDTWKDGRAGYPSADANSITGVAAPTVASAGKPEDTGPTGWTTGLDIDSANDVARAIAGPAAAVS